MRKTEYENSTSKEREGLGREIAEESREEGMMRHVREENRAVVMYY